MCNIYIYRYLFFLQLFKKKNFKRISKKILTGKYITIKQIFNPWQNDWKKNWKINKKENRMSHRYVRHLAASGLPESGETITVFVTSGLLPILFVNIYITEIVV